MKFEFNQGVPPGCFDWLWDHIGTGNRGPNRHDFSVVYGIDQPEYDWFYDREFVPFPNTRSEGKSIPTITVKNPKKAVLFALRWI